MEIKMGFEDVLQSLEENSLEVVSTLMYDVSNNYDICKVGDRLLECFLNHRIALVAIKSEKKLSFCIHSIQKYEYVDSEFHWTKGLALHWARGGYLESEQPFILLDYCDSMTSIPTNSEEKLSLDRWPEILNALRRMLP